MLLLCFNTAVIGSEVSMTGWKSSNHVEAKSKSYRTQFPLLTKNWLKHLDKLAFINSSNTNKTRKFSCLNVRGIPPPCSKCSLCCCLQMGVVVPHPVLDLGGTPSSPGWGSTLGYPPPTWTWDGVAPPAWTWDGYPPSPPPGPGMGYPPHHHQLDGVPPLLPPGPGMGYPPPKC